MRFLVLMGLVGSSLGALAQDAGVPVQAAIGLVSPSSTCAAPCRETTAAANALLTLSAETSRGAASQFWELISRPQSSAAGIENAGQVVATITPDLPGLYEIGLTVIGTNGEVSSARLKVEVALIPFLLTMRMKVDGKDVECAPVCPSETVRIASDVEVDATGSSHDTTRGALDFSWQLTFPPGSTAQLNTVTGNGGGKVSFRPDVDGPYEVRLTLKDSREQAEASVAFQIDNPLQWKPFSCAHSSASPAGWAVFGGLLWWLRRRRPQG